MLLVGFNTMEERGIRAMFGRLCTSRNFLSLAEVHFLGSSCRNSYTMSLGTNDPTGVLTGLDGADSLRMVSPLSELSVGHCLR